MEKIGKRRGGKWMELLLMLLLVWLCGCDRKWPMNGALDGQWQLLTVETRADGVVTDRKDEQTGGIPSTMASEFSDDLFTQPLCSIGVKTESKGNDHRKAVQHVHSVAVRLTDTLFCFAGIQDAVLVHGFYRRTERGGNHAEQFHQFRFIHPDGCPGHFRHMKYAVFIQSDNVTFHDF